MKWVWPMEQPKIVENFMNSGIDLMQEKFGALSQDPSNIYSRICVGNSLISLEPYRGCPLKCAYCMANNDVRSLNLEKYNGKDYESIILRKPEKVVSTVELVEALVKHPIFIPNKSVIGFCTGSSEFFLPELKDDLWDGFMRLVELGLSNPIWLVVKSYLAKGYEDEWLNRFKYLDDHGIKVILSISDIGAPADIEPYQTDRFKVFDFLKNSTVTISHHMRPIIPGEYFTDELIDSLLDRSLEIVKSVCVGGLRIDPGMSIFWDNEVTQKYDSFAGNQTKIFDKNILDIVTRKIKEHGKEIPVFDKTSAMLAHHIGIQDFNLYRYRDNLDGALLHIGEAVIQHTELKFGKKLDKILNDVSSKILLKDIKFNIKENKVYVSRNLQYQEERALIHAIGHLEILE